MGIFINLFTSRKKKNKDLIYQKANIVISDTTNFSTELLEAISNEYEDFELIKNPELKEHFEYSATIASIGSIMTQIHLNFNPEKTKFYLYAINVKSKNWNQKSTKSIIEYGRYINNLSERNEINSKDDLAEATGSWIFLNLDDEFPNNENIEKHIQDRKLIYIVGSSIIDQFFNYWDRN